MFFWVKTFLRHKTQENSIKQIQEFGCHIFSFICFFLDVQWTKVLLVPQKCEIIMELFSIAPCNQRG